MDARVMESADVDPHAVLGDGTMVWHLAQVRELATIGRDCIIGRGAYVGTGVTIGDRCKLQNYALVYEPAEIGDGVFIGPGVILTNDPYPRSVSATGSLKRADSWQATGVIVGTGAAIGARAVVVAGVSIGPWALVGAGAVVARDVPPHALVVGNPARRIGWVGYEGVPLNPEDGGLWRCPRSGATFEEANGQLMETT